MRPIDLARGLGLSTQAVRNYEAAGILPPARRTESGYRVYTALHAQALETFAALVPAHGHATATAIMRAANVSAATDDAANDDAATDDAAHNAAANVSSATDDAANVSAANDDAAHNAAVDDVLRLLDESHAQLFEDRLTLAAVTEALHRLVPTADPAVGPTLVGPLAHQLGLRPATLRKWERAGLLRPSRDRRTGYRVYTPDNVRDARLAHQLRRGGYPIKKIVVLLEQVRAAGGVEPLEAALGQWRDRLTAQGRAMLAGAAALHSYLAARALPQGSQNLPDKRVARERRIAL